MHNFGWNDVIVTGGVDKKAFGDFFWYRLKPQGMKDFHKGTLQLKFQHTRGSAPSHFGIGSPHTNRKWSCGVLLGRCVIP